MCEEERLLGRPGGAGGGEGGGALGGGGDRGDGDGGDGDGGLGVALSAGIATYQLYTVNDAPIKDTQILGHGLHRRIFALRCLHVELAGQII